MNKKLENLMKQIEEKIEDENLLEEFEEKCLDATFKAFDCDVILEVELNEDLELVDIQVYEIESRHYYISKNPTFVKYVFSYKRNDYEMFWDECIDNWKQDNFVFDYQVEDFESEEEFEEARENAYNEFDYDYDEVREDYNSQFHCNFDYYNYENNYFEEEIERYFEE
jgi:hypothetical protein